jgi:phosphatidate cytidylyltransferase
MWKRILFGAVMIAAVAGLLVLDWHLQRQSERLRIWPRAPIIGIPIATAIALLLLKAFLELEGLAAAAAARLLPVSGLIGVWGLGMFPFWRQLVGIWFAPAAMTALLAIIVMLVFAEQMSRRPAQEAFGNVACTLLAVLYLGVGGAMMLQIRFSFGVPALAFFLVVVKMTDIGAYFTGSFIGRHKLIPAVSPGKSWEGLAGGIIAAAGSAMLAVHLLAGLQGDHCLAGVSPWQAAVFGVVLALAGQFADLCESLLKRSARVKDSAAAVPEFGGVLDIMDSVLLAAPIGWLLLSSV